LREVRRRSDGPPRRSCETGQSRWHAPHTHLSETVNPLVVT